MGAVSDAELLALFERLALEAGKAIMAVYESGFEIRSKDDSSPVTEADQRAEAIILRGLREAAKDFACVAEEEASAGIAPSRPGATFFLVDPLDGTREFVSRNPDFTVNIALIRDGAPVAGVVYAPARDTLYSGAGHRASRVEQASTAAPLRSRISVREPSGRLVIVSSRSHGTPDTDAFLKTQGDAEIVHVGSSLKFCLIAEGTADLYVRFGRTMQWDTAAGDAVLRAAGGTTNTVDGLQLTYGARETGDAPFANPWFVSTGGVRV